MIDDDRLDHDIKSEAEKEEYIWLHYMIIIPDSFHYHWEPLFIVTWSAYIKIQIDIASLTYLTMSWEALFLPSMKFWGDWKSQLSCYQRVKLLF